MTTAPPIASDNRTDETWSRWLMQTAKTWDDVSGVIKETGIEAIDFDHRQMTEAVLEISNLLDLVEEGGLRMEAIQRQERVLENLYAYAARHFAREIKIIKKYDLPGYEEQRTQHKNFLMMLSSMIQDFREGRLTASHNVKAEILDWWVRHINNVDFNTFCSENWTTAIIRNASAWGDVSHLIRRTGVESLDDEHREMTATALELVYGLGEARGEAAIDDIFQRLIWIAEEHFEDEEAFIEHFNLPGLAHQREQHRGFLATLTRHRTEVASGQSVITEEMRFEILDWWITHVNTVDYNSFSLDKHAPTILAATDTWEQAGEFIKKTDVGPINDDHRDITLLIIGLDPVIADAAVGAEGWRDRAAEQFRALIEACQRHFEREHGIMVETDFAGFSQHREQHGKFIQTWTKKADDIAQGRAIPTDKSKHALLEWWVQHIREFDMKAFSDRRELNQPRTDKPEAPL